jgi:putative Holliday junction resolvase
VRVLALDYGEARCGCAVSDPTGTLATPAGIVERPGTKRGIQRIAQLAREREIALVLIGLPLTMAGEEGAQAREARDFGARVAAATNLPVEFHDERLTTRQAARTGGSAPEDARAAAVLLEAWLVRTER